MRLTYTDVINGSEEILYPLSSEINTTVFEDPVIYGFKQGTNVTDYIDVDINENTLVIFVSTINFYLTKASETQNQLRI